jgi:hypothetical protein
VGVVEGGAQAWEVAWRGGAVAELGPPLQRASGQSFDCRIHDHLGFTVESTIIWDLLRTIVELKILEKFKNIPL